MGKAEDVFGGYLKKLRDARGLTLREVEEKAKVSNAFLSQVERGERGIPTFKVLTKLSGVYGVSPSELIKVAEEAARGKKVSGQSDMDFVARGFEKLTEAEKKEMKEWLSWKLMRRQKGHSEEK